MTHRYVVLRAIRGLLNRDQLTDTRSGSAGITGVEPAEPRVEVESLTTKEVRNLSRDPEVAAIAAVMPTRLIEPFEASKSSTASAWGVKAVKADTSAYDGDGAVVAVLDTGIDDSHPAFQGVSLVQQDFTRSGSGDQNGHGTHCAGTIFGRDVSGMRIGVARGVKKALIGKVLDNNGRGDSDSLFQAIPWALNGGAKIISMSLGFDFPGLVNRLSNDGWPIDLATSVALEAYRGNLRLFDSLMALVRSRVPFDGGAVVVAAAGNESQRQIRPDYEISASLPAAAEGVISVAALGESSQGLVVANFSNIHAAVSAPGIDILSAKLGGGLKGLSGTSMAAPHVTGVAALWWQAIREAATTVLNARVVTTRLLSTVRTDVFAAGVDVADRGDGLVTAPS